MFKRYALGFLGLMLLLAAFAQTSRQNLARYGTASIRGYDRFSATVKGTKKTGYTYSFIYTGKGTLLTAEDGPESVTLAAERISGEAATEKGSSPGAAGKIGFRWAKASGTVRLTLKQRDAEGVMRKITAWAAEMTYRADERTVTLSGNVKIVSEDPPITHTGSSGLIRLTNEGYEINFEGGGETRLNSAQPPTGAKP